MNHPLLSTTFACEPLKSKFNQVKYCKFIAINKYDLIFENFGNKFLFYLRNMLSRILEKIEIFKNDLFYHLNLHEDATLVFIISQVMKKYVKTISYFTPISY